MRDVVIQSVAIVVAGVALAAAMVRGAQVIANSGRYALVQSGESVAVLDTRNGLLQTFERSDQAPHVFRYIGNDSRNLHLGRIERAGKSEGAAEDRR